MNERKAYISSGLLVYRINLKGEREYLLVHPSGEKFKDSPFGIPKGRPDEADNGDLKITAIRETREECSIESEVEASLGHVVYVKTGSVIHCWLARYLSGPVDKHGHCTQLQWENDVGCFVKYNRAMLILRSELKQFLQRAEEHFTQKEKEKEQG